MEENRQGYILIGQQLRNQFGGELFHVIGAV